MERESRRERGRKESEWIRRKVLVGWIKGLLAGRMDR